MKGMFNRKLVCDIANKLKIIRQRAFLLHIPHTGMITIKVTKKKN